jgi:hypothetical protein
MKHFSRHFGFSAAIRTFALGLSWLVLFSLGLAPLQARTLFIDLNNAEPEINAIKKGVGGKAEEVVVIPSYERISKKQRSGVLKAQLELDQFTQEAQECAVSVKKDKACSSVYERIRAAELSRESYARAYSTADLVQEITALAATSASRPFAMVVISGHHENGFYMGELSKIRAAELAELVRGLPGVFASVKTLLMLGCGTGTKENFENMLLPMFPQVQVIVAAEDNAPLRDEPRNLAFVRRVMNHRQTLVTAHNPQIVKAIYGHLLAQNWPVSILWGQHLVFFKDRTERLSTPVRPLGL